MPGVTDLVNISFGRLPVSARPGLREGALKGPRLEGRGPENGPRWVVQTREATGRLLVRMPVMASA